MPAGDSSPPSLPIVSLPPLEAPAAPPEPLAVLQPVNYERRHPPHRPFRRRHLRKWAGRIPREIGATLVSEAIGELLTIGNGAAVKSVEFVTHADARRKRSKN
jgi:hypothetical protein